MNIQKLKEWLIQAYLDASNQSYLSLDSDIAIKAYENNIMQRDIEIYEFDNYDLVGFSAFNRFNDGGGSRGNPALWRNGIRYVAEKSRAVSIEKIDVLQLDELRYYLLAYLDEGQALAFDPGANERVRDNLKNHNQKSSAWKAMKTVNSFTLLLHTLPSPNVDGLANHLLELGEIDSKNALYNCRSLLMQVYGYGVPLAQNFVKDFLLAYANKEKLPFDQIEKSIFGKLTKADLWMKRIFALYVDQNLLDRTTSYSHVTEKQSESILKDFNSHEKWETGYTEIMSSVCQQNTCCPLEIDRVIYSIFSTNFHDGLAIYKLPKMELCNLRKIWS